MVEVDAKAALSSAALAAGALWAVEAIASVPCAELSAPGGQLLERRARHAELRRRWESAGRHLSAALNIVRRYSVAEENADQEVPR